MDGSAEGMTALVFYLLVYMAANLGAFAVMTSIEDNSGKIQISDYKGLYKTNPKLAFLMTLCLFSLAGIPPFAGFFSKFFIFMAAFKGGHELLVFIALINTVVSLYYYLLIVKAMYIEPNDSPIATFKSDCYVRTALALCTAGVVLLGIVSWFYNGIESLSYGI
jgi:NADH-quinone oxidoreductase subunit N